MVCRTARTIRTSILLTIVLFGFVNSYGKQKATDPGVPKYSELSGEDKTRLERQRALVAAVVKQRYGKPALTKTVSDLAVLQRLLDDRVFGKTQTYQLQSMGVAFGDVLVSELPLRWVMVTDEYGTDPTLRFEKTTIQINALTMVSKRIERNEAVNLSELLRATRNQLRQLEQSARVEGIASNVATGEPVHDAQVDICVLPHSKAVGPCFRTNTDENGKFTFNGLPAGHYYAKAKSPGFVSDYIVRSGDAIALDAQGSAEFDLATEDVHAVRLRLWPAAAVSGRITDESGRPIPGVSVAAIAETYGFGRRHFGRYRRLTSPETLSNKNGEFRIGEMRPGRYYLEAFFDALSKPDPATFQKGYVPIYYPDAAFLASAIPLCVGPGEFRADFVLHPRATYTVRAKLALPADFRRDVEPVTGLRNEYGELLHSWTREYDHDSQALALGHLTSGSYEIETATGIYDTDPIAKRKFTVIDADVDGLLFHLQRPFKLRVNVHLPHDFRPTTSYSVLLLLQPAEEAMDVIESGWPITKDGELQVPGLRPGQYNLYLFGDDNLYLKEARFRQQDVLANGLALETAPTDALEVTLERTTGEIRGTVLEEKALPLAAADVKLIAQGEDSPYVARSASTDREGSFHFFSVPPGIYDLVALNDTILDSEFGSSEWAQVKDFAKRVEVGDSTQASVDLKATGVRYYTSSCKGQLPQQNDSRHP